MTIDYTDGVSPMEFILALAALLSALAVIWRYVVVPLRKLGQRSGEFFDDWFGTPPREGVPARPGVMRRLEVLEAHGAKTAAEVTNNGGSSLKDSVDRIERQLGTKP